MSDEQQTSSSDLSASPAEVAAEGTRLGELIEVSEGGSVIRPDGVAVTVTGGSYVLNQVGTYDIDGEEVEVDG